MRQTSEIAQIGSGIFRFYWTLLVKLVRNMGLFGKEPKADPKEQVREWSRKLRHEQRSLDRQINGIQREENKAKRQIKDAAKKVRLVGILLVRLDKVTGLVIAPPPSPHPNRSKQTKANQSN